MTSSADRRLCKVASALSPREAVLAWLLEAQQFGSLEDHARSIALLPVEAAPLSVIGRRIEASVRASMKGQPREATEDAVRRAVGDGAFLFVLVLQLNGQTLELANVESLRAAAVFYWMGSLLGGPRADDLPPAEAKVYARELGNAWARWRTVVHRLSLDVRVENEARASVERRYFGGHDVFFPDVSIGWTKHVDMVERLATLAESLAGKRSRRRGTSGSYVATSLEERVVIRVAKLADDARVRTYEIMGERGRAVAIMERRLLGNGT